jgi:hypothetical protein
MNPFEIYITYVSWGTDGKSRPVLISSAKNGAVTFYPITTKYQNKSDTIKAKYYPIKDWQKAGLNIKSYVDTGTQVTYPESAFPKSPIGKLTKRDKHDLLAFLAR